MARFVYSQAQKYARKLHTNDPFALLDALGAVVIRSDRYRQDGLRGFCTVIGRIRYVVINAKQSVDEQRIVAAHEAGHLILHGERLKVGTLKDLELYNGTSRLEREANLFAADFLIGDEETVGLIREKDADFFSVAGALRVPPPLFAFKLYSMVSRGFRVSVPMTPESAFLKRSDLK